MSSPKINHVHKITYKKKSCQIDLFMIGKKTSKIFMLNHYGRCIMRKFIALKNEIYYSMEQEGDTIRFYANRQGTGYDTRKDVTPTTLPNKIIIDEIVDRPTICSEKSRELDVFLDDLEKIFKMLTD